MLKHVPLLLLLFSACAPATRPPAPVPPVQPLRATGTAQRVVLLTFDGLGADAYSAQTGLTSFEHLARNGAIARILPVDPTLTSSTHVSILTGADPRVHGVVSNMLHLPGRPPGETTRGGNTEIDVETLVEAARRQGKRVGAVPFPTVDAANARRSADFGMVWTAPLTPSRMVRLNRASFKREWVPPTWTSRPQRRRSSSPVMRARIEWSVPNGPRADVDLVAYDTTDDGVENYDLYTVENEDRELEADERGWFAIERNHHGSWSKIVSRGPSLDVTLYWGAISRTVAYPDDYRRLLDEEAGFWPGAPDESAPIDPTLFSEQLERLSEFMSRAQAVTIRRVPFDLLLAYQPPIDQAMHSFLGRDEGVIRRSFVAADRALAAVGSLLDVHRDAFLVLGDHGLVPTKNEVHLGRLLADHGLAPRWRVYASNSVAHLHRFGPPDDTDAVVALLRASGHFERVEKRSASSHRNSGDIVATTEPSLTVSASDDAPILGPPRSAGHHGGLPHHSALQPAFFASGFGVPRGTLGVIPQTAIARFVAELLGIEPPIAAN